MNDNFGRTLISSRIKWEYAEAEQGYEWVPGDEWTVMESTPRVDQPDFNIALLPYQLASIYSMIQIETYKCFLTGTREIFSSVFRFSNDMGSGKTATILGLIRASPVPTNGPMYMIPIDPVMSGGPGGQPCSVITRRFRKVCRPALIFVGYGVLNQWVAEVEKFVGVAKWDYAAKRFGPGMKIFVVDGIAALKRFYALIHSSEINLYDAILIKNKDVTGQWQWQHGEQEGIVAQKVVRKIWNMIAVMCRNMCFTRLIIDDFDTIGIPPVAGNINALATWLVSSTQAEIQDRTWQNSEHTRLESMVHHNIIGFGQIMKNRAIHELFNVRVQPEYVRRYMQAGRVQYFYNKFDNASGRVLDLINCMSGKRVADILEALNGDAVGEAARIAGIEVENPNEIFKALLQQNYDQLREAKIVLTHFEEYFSKIDIDALPGFSENPNPRDTYTHRDLRARRELKWRYPGVRQLLAEELEKWRATFAECSAALQKFKSSVKNNECTVCSCELDDPDENYAIMPCCHELLHANCAVRGCTFVRRGDAIVGRCPFDRSHTVHWEKMTYIRGGFDLAVIDENKILEPEPPSAKPVEDTKYDALIKIIRGGTLGESIALDIPSVVQNSEPLGPPAYIKSLGTMIQAGLCQEIAPLVADLLFPRGGPRTLVFASFDEALLKTETRLTAETVRWERLGGTATNMSRQIKAFWQGEINTLTIKSTTHCSSLNLQCADNLVFMHQIQDANIMRQIIGRIQRTGRVSDARVYWLLFRNEISSLDQYKI